MSAPWEGCLRLGLTDSPYGHWVHATEPNERDEYEHVANVFGEAQARALVHRANAYDGLVDALEEADAFLSDHRGRQLHSDDCAVRRGGQGTPGTLGPECDCGLWGLRNKVRALVEGEREAVT